MSPSSISTTIPLDLIPSDRCYRERLDIGADGKPTGKLKYCVKQLRDGDVFNDEGETYGFSYELRYGNNCGPPRFDNYSGPRFIENFEGQEESDEEIFFKTS